MLQLERQKLILEYLKQNRKATTNDSVKCLEFPPQPSVPI